LQISYFGMLTERIADKKKNARVSSIQMLNNLFFIRQARSFKYQIKLIIIRSIALHSMSCLRINFFSFLFFAKYIITQTCSLSRPKENWLTDHDVFFFLDVCAAYVWRTHLHVIRQMGSTRHVYETIGSECVNQSVNQRVHENVMAIVGKKFLLRTIASVFAYPSI